MGGPHHRESLVLRVSITDRCQLRCRYCLPEEGITLLPAENILRYEDIAVLVRHLQADFELTKVRITGGEPLVRRDVDRLVRMLAELGIPDLALTTNGQLLEEFAPILKRAGLHRVNVSLDSLNPETFAALSRGGALAHTVAGIRRAREVGLTPVKVNTVVGRGVNDGEAVALVNFALADDIEVRFIELMPLGEAERLFAASHVPAAEIQAQLAAVFRIEAIPDRPGETSRSYRITDDGGRQGIVGFVNPCTQPFCCDCRRLRLTSDGQLVGCLADGESVPIRSLLRQPGGPDTAALRAAVAAALGAKQRRRGLLRQDRMATIGG